MCFIKYCKIVRLYIHIFWNFYFHLEFENQVVLHSLPGRLLLRLLQVSPRLGDYLLKVMYAICCKDTAKRLGIFIPVVFTGSFTLFTLSVFIPPCIPVLYLIRKAARWKSKNRYHWIRSSIISAAGASTPYQGKRHDTVICHYYCFLRCRNNLCFRMRSVTAYGWYWNRGG